MRKFFMVSLFILGLSCSDDDTFFDQEKDLLGTWRLVEQYVDPGDGSGDFQPVNSDKRVTFTANSTYSANGSLCFIDTDSNEEVSGTYEINEENLAEFSSENYLIPEDCNFEGAKVFIHFDGSDLILSYLCIEGCAQKYRKE